MASRQKAVLFQNLITESVERNQQKFDAGKVLISLQRKTPSSGNNNAWLLKAPANPNLGAE